MSDDIDCVNQNVELNHVKHEAAITHMRSKLWDIDIVVKEIQEFPQTYNSILGDQCCHATLQFMLRSKLNKLCKDGTIHKMSIPGTRFGKVIFYYPEKKYHILVKADRIGSQVYCFFKYKYVGKYYIKADSVWHLENGVWKKSKDNTFFEGNVLKFV